MIDCIHLPLPRSVVAFSTCRGKEATEADSYSGFSVCHYTNDQPIHYQSCRLRLIAEAGIKPECIIIPRQTHSDRVAVIDSIPFPSYQLEGVDALVTTMPGVMLCVNTADCVPVVLADPTAGIIAIAHCGWRGIVNDLLPHLLAAMRSHGADPNHIHAAMGPSICPSCFEVGEEVALEFRQAFPGSKNIVLGPTATRVKPHINLPAAIATRLTAAGVPAEAIATPSACSRCNPMRFYSARALSIRSGRILTAVMRDHNLPRLTPSSR